MVFPMFFLCNSDAGVDSGIAMRYLSCIFLYWCLGQNCFSHQDKGRFGKNIPGSNSEKMVGQFT